MEININYIKENNKKYRKYNAIELPNPIKQDMLPKYVIYYKECYNNEKQLYREYFKIENHPLLKNESKILISSKSNKISVSDKFKQIIDMLKYLELNNKNTEFKENDLKENDLKENDLKENDLKENDLKENDLKENDLKENDLKENLLNNKENDLKENDLKENDLKENDLKENDLKENLLNNKENTLNKKIVLPKYFSIKKHEKDNNKYYIIFDKKNVTSRQSCKAICNNNISFEINFDNFLKKLKEKYDI